MKRRSRSGRSTGKEPSQRIVQARGLLAVLLKTQRRSLSRLLARTPAAAPTRAQSIGALADDRELIATILLTIASAGVMLLTYRGTSMLMAEHGEGLVQKGEALTFAVVIGVLVWLGWYFLFGLLHRLRGRRLAGALAAGGIYVATVACIDAPFNMLALGGGSAVQLSLVDTASHYEAERTAAFARTAAVRRLVPGIKAQAASFKASETREIKGAETGKPKPGKVSASFGRVGTLLGDLGDLLDNGLKEADTIQADITAALARMKKHVHAQGDIRARAEAVSVEADRIDELLGRLAQFDMTVSVKATLRSLESAVRVPKVASTSFEAVQNGQIALIAETARSAAANLQQALAELATAPASKAEPVRPADPMSAIRTYWRPLLPQWIAALFVDLAPGLLLFILIAARREAEQAENSNDTERGSS